MSTGMGRQKKEAEESQECPDGECGENRSSGYMQWDEEENRWGMWVRTEAVGCMQWDEEESIDSQVRSSPWEGQVVKRRGGKPRRATWARTGPVGHPQLRIIERPRIQERPPVVGTTPSPAPSEGLSQWEEGTPARDPDLHTLVPDASAIGPLLPLPGRWFPRLKSIDVH
ncbi:hypothetical protein NDU88_000002 [Pleurodeles waltl]|uniref:Uncharacterized protein n=1 Tax=Pleurodeles waltl TaxID=8319 RepID=A0AAV7V5S2_PLEWA|nr:hypothetical protein NDU88_000002 [Pleurodeles waltl]